MFATIGMTPATQRKKLLKPITSLYNKDVEDDSSELDSMKEYSETPKVIVKADDAAKNVMNVEYNADHPDLLLPVADEQTKDISGDDLDFAEGDSNLSDDKLEAILDSAPL